MKPQYLFVLLFMSSSLVIPRISFSTEGDQNPTQPDATQEGREVTGSKESKPKSEVQAKDGEGVVEKGDYYRFFGDKISLRANEKFVYIKAGDTTIVADAKGQVQIKAAGDLILTTPATMTLSAGKDIQLKAGGQVTTQGGAKDQEAPR